jgi:CheY-like chemotaxis protein
MARIRVVHWKSTEAGPLLETLRSAGYKVEYDAKLIFPGSLRAWRQSPPDAFVIDLSRLPAHGREVAIALRGSKATWRIPIVFVGGVPEKVEAVCKWLPDAVYTSNTRIRSSLRRALAHPPVVRVRPAQMMDRFGGRTAAQKLGIREGASVALIDPPRDFARVLGEVPPGVTFQESGEECKLTLWFVYDPEVYLNALPRMRNIAGRTRLWVLWKKQAASKGSSAITQNFLRESAIAIGLVDYKICSVNETWSGLAFARKRDTSK